MAKNRNSRRGVTRRSSAPAGDGPEYRNWLTLVPPDKREAFAAAIQEESADDYDGLVSMAKTCLVQLLGGTMTPAISKEARQWTELMFSIQATKNSAQGTPEAGYQDIITALVQVRREAPKIEAAYTVIDNDVENYVEPEKVAFNE